MHLAHVEDGNALRQRNTPIARVLKQLERMRMLEQGFGRDASPDQTRAAERPLPLNHGDLLTELGCANRRDITTSTRTDDDDVVCTRH